VKLVFRGTAALVNSYKILNTIHFPSYEHINTLKSERIEDVMQFNL